jgi:hypothetical protein
MHEISARRMVLEDGKQPVEELQANVDRKWKQLLKRCGEEE